MVDILPFLAKVLAWFPGAGFKRIAREWRGSLEEMVSAPTNRWHRHCVFYFESLGSDVSAEEELVVKWSALFLYAGGSDTVCSYIFMFLIIRWNPYRVWPATPNPSSVLSNLALQLPLGSLNKMLTTKLTMVRPEKRAGMTLRIVVICMFGNHLLPRNFCERNERDYVLIILTPIFRPAAAQFLHVHEA
ncbi:hypothetical protein EV424DRAFT_439541 [Suillus variegatus]|nr:hypothetical protein EV424DRAFT_439541 [Suillus variegatus]